MDDHLIRYERDGSVTFVQGDRTQTLPPGWTDLELDAAATIFFAPPAA